MNKAFGSPETPLDYTNRLRMVLLARAEMKVESRRRIPGRIHEPADDQLWSVPCVFPRRCRWLLTRLTIVNLDLPLCTYIVLAYTIMIVSPS